MEKVTSHLFVTIRAPEIFALPKNKEKCNMNQIQNRKVFIKYDSNKGKPGVKAKNVDRGSRNLISVRLTPDAFPIIIIKHDSESSKSYFQPSYLDRRSRQSPDLTTTN